MIEAEHRRSSRGKTLAFLAISLGFVAIALFLPSHGRDDGWRIPSAIFFGLCAAVFVLLLVRPQRLILDAEGFTLAGGLARSPRRVAWRDIDGFFVYRLPRGGKMIGYNHAPHARKDSYLGDLSRRLGADGAFPKTFAGSPDAIVADLNAYRERALARPMAASGAPRRPLAGAELVRLSPPPSPLSFGRKRRD